MGSRTRIDRLTRATHRLHSVQPPPRFVEIMGGDGEILEVWDLSRSRGTQLLRPAELEEYKAGNYAETT